MKATASGPWITRYDGCKIAEFYGPDAEANARLCAAAPDLAEALKPFDKWLSTMPDHLAFDNPEKIIAGEGDCAIRAKHLRAARLALSRADGGENGWLDQQKLIADLAETLRRAKHELEMAADQIRSDGKPYHAEDCEIVIKIIDAALSRANGGDNG